MAEPVAATAIAVMAKARASEAAVTYGTDVSAEFISNVTEAVMAEVTAWEARPLEPIYPVVFFDALRVKIKEDAVVRNKAIYLALGVLPDGIWTPPMWQAGFEVLTRRVLHLMPSGARPPFPHARRQGVGGVHTI